MVDRTPRVKWVVSSGGAYAVGAVGLFVGYAAADVRGAVAGGAAGYFGVKSLRSLYWGL